MRAYLKHKLNLSLLFTILLCTSSSNTFAFDAIIDGIYYYFLDGKAHVTCYAYNSKYNKTAYSGNVVIPETITYYGQTFNVKYIDDHAFIGCTGLTSVTIPNSVISIGSSAFDGCRSLTSVTIPESITTINSYTFTSCSALTSITIPESVKSIGEGAFRWSGITSVTIPESVTSIGENAFYECSGLTSITCEALTPPVCGSGCFILVDTSSCTLYVPEISVDAYKNADEWKYFYNIIGVATGINDVKITDFEDSLYDLSGRKLSKPQRGINIIRNNDGTAKKVVVK